jgi:hypothetical protein
MILNMNSLVLKQKNILLIAWGQTTSQEMLKFLIIDPNS